MNSFENGRRLKSRGQRYVILGLTDYWTRDDRCIQLVRYQSVCAEPGCKRLFLGKATKTGVRRGKLNRRCELHRAPGLPVPVKKRKSKPKPKVRAKAVTAVTACHLRRSQSGEAMRQLLLRNEQSLKLYGRPSYLD